MRTRDKHLYSHIGVLSSTEFIAKVYVLRAHLGLVSTFLGNFLSTAPALK